MRPQSISRNKVERMEPAFVGADSRASEPRSASIHVLNSSTRPGPHRGSVRSARTSPDLWNETAEFLADIDGVSVLVRFLVQDAPAEMQSEPGSGETDIHSLLSSTLEKMVGRRRGSRRQRGDSSKQPLGKVELLSSGEPLDELPAVPNETVLRVGPLELDLIDRTARRGDRQIDLRPREFRLLKYMVQRSDQLLTRAILLKEVWHYKFVPETNLVDVHMGRLRRKIDGSNEAPMIRNVRGVGFVLSAPPASQGSATRPAERSTTAGARSPRWADAHRNESR